MQIPILSGISSDANADLRTQYPVNLIPVPKDTGVSKGYLRAAWGLTAFGTGPGIDRGGINWNGTCYRVMGTKLVSVQADGSVVTLGDVGAGGWVTMDYSVDRLCVLSDGNAYYWDSTTLTQITDADVGSPLDVVWVDGYFLFTDGGFLYVTDLNTPTSIDPLKYAASEIDPDRIVGVLKYRNEVYALNRYTIEVFDNIGGTGFPFTRLPGGLIPKGCVGTKAKTLFGDTFAWVGSGRNEPCSVYLANGGSALKIASREVEKRLAGYTEAELATAVVEAKADSLHQHLMIHLPWETLVYDAAASAAVGEPVWFFLSSGTGDVTRYRARNFVWCYGKWLVGDLTTSTVGYADESTAAHYGESVGCQFDTMLVYNASKGAIVWSMELVGTFGRATLGETPTVFHSYTLDGVNRSNERQVSMGTMGQTQQRVVSRQCGTMQNVRSDRFRWSHKTPASIMRLEAELEPLNA